MFLLKKKFLPDKYIDFKGLFFHISGHFGVKTTI